MKSESVCKVNITYGYSHMNLIQYVNRHYIQICLLCKNKSDAYEFFRI